MIPVWMKDEKGSLMSQPQAAAGPAGPGAGRGELRTLRVGPVAVPPGSFAIMAVVNRTPDSFFDHGATYEFGAAQIGRAHV